MKIGEYETHPAADVFPLLEGAEFDKFAADIGEQGLLQPITRVWVDDPACPGQRKPLILDGRNRLRACFQACIKPAFVDYTGDDPVAHVVSLNERRRHMSESQRGMVAGRIANLPRGANQHVSIETSSQGAAADLMDVSRQTVLRARVVLEKGIPEVIAAVDSGDLAISAADPLARMPAEAQREVLEKAGGDSRKVRALVREAGGAAPAYVGAAKRKEPTVDEAPLTPEAPLTDRQRVSREIDAKVRRMHDTGATQAEIARAIGVHGSTVSHSLRRQGVIKKAHPIQSIERRMRETADDLGSFMGQPEVYRDGADDEDREQCIKSLRALQGAVSRVINWLNKEANGDRA